MRHDTSLRRIQRGASLALACALLLGCATASTRAADQQRLRKATSHLDIGVGYMSTGRSALALREFLNAEALDPKNPKIQYALSDAYLARGKPAEAEQHLKRALELHPDYHDARVSLTGVYMIQKRYEEAIEQCNILLEDPTFPAPYGALANRGLAEHALGRDAEARKSLEQARGLNGKYWPALLTLATLEEDGGHRVEAVQLLETVLDLEPGARVESEVNYRLAENYIALGKRDRALAYLSTSVARAPEGPWAKKAEAYLKLLR
jgi:type IV pilus assembly protein PilF